jgi:hypothetical protein
MAHSKIDLTPLQFVATSLIGREVASRLGVEPRVDLMHTMLHDLELRLSTHVWAVSPPEREFDLRWPSTWWQGFKDACYRRSWVVPVWWKKKWPARWSGQKFSIEELYPEFRAKLDERCVIAVVDHGAWGDPPGWGWDPEVPVP